LPETYWTKRLLPNPARPVPLLLDLKFIKTVGFLECNPRSEPIDNYSKIYDAEMESKIRTLGIDFDSNLYRVIKPTLKGNFNSIRKYDQDPEISLDERVHNLAMDYMYNKYRPYADSCPETYEEELQFNMKSSCGHYFKAKYGFKRTSQIFESISAIEDLRSFYSSPEYPTLWQSAAKEEMLPMDKIIENMPRTFIIPDKRLQYLCMRLLQSQHELFLELANHPDFVQASGLNFYKGGFDKIMRQFYGFLYIFAGDASKWDSSLKRVIFSRVIIPIRALLFKPPLSDATRLFTARERENFREQFENRLREMYADMVCAYIVLPNGQVIATFGGMKSGWFLTSDDNTLYHEYVMVSIAIMLAVIINVSKLMSDDHLAATNDAAIVPYHVRRSHYAKFGLVLKEAADCVTEKSPVGHTFLGFKCEYREEFGKFVPVFDYRRLCCMLTQPGKRITPAVRYMRVAAARILAYFTPPRDNFKELAKRCFDTAYLSDLSPVLSGSCTEEEFESLCKLHTDLEIECLWLGFESSGDGLKSIDTLLFLENHDEDEDSENASESREVSWSQDGI